MKTVIVTGSAGLVGGAASARFHEMGYRVVGIDNDMRSRFFGPEASTLRARGSLKALPNYEHVDADIRNHTEMERVFRQYMPDIAAVVHCAAQPSHDWAARDPHLDFEINALGTLNLLTLAHQFSPESPFIFMSTNKVYGDRPNEISLTETTTRWTPTDIQLAEQGISEAMSIDQSTHSLFGASKTAADLLVQEYGRYFGMPTVAFRGGCLTGPTHAGAELHGFLSYLVKCVIQQRPYRIFGYKGKQVRDNIHSDDLVEAFVQFISAPRVGQVYNIGGGPFANVSMLEAIEKIEALSGKKLKWTLEHEARVGDHIWYVSDLSRFMNDYPDWQITRNIDTILEEMVASEISRDHRG